MVYFGSCLTLAAQGDELRSFCRVSGAKAIFDYTKKVDWLKSAACDFLLLPHMLNAVYFRPVYKHLLAEHPGFSRDLGLRFASAREASVRLSRRPRAGT